MKVDSKSSLSVLRHASHPADLLKQCMLIPYNMGICTHADLEAIARLTKSLGRAAAFEADLQYLLG